MPDDLQIGVDKPDLYVAEDQQGVWPTPDHYGALVNPARAARPKDKPRLERPMPYIRDSFWRGREFTSIEHMQAEAVARSQKVGGRRQCRPLRGAAPMAVFEAVEAETLLPLPPTPVVLARWSTEVVGPDFHIKIGRPLYSVTWKPPQPGRRLPGATNAPIHRSPDRRHRIRRRFSRPVPGSGPRAPVPC
ncbi:hypothetical protein [Streptomyces sp. NPDC002587]